jgi:4a-hydroxytetrahydrobiopterin dehydratase
MTKAPVLTESQLNEALQELQTWQWRDGQIERTVTAKSFPEGIQLVRQVADFAEQANHHPNIDIRYRNVTFYLSTHDSGGITQKDIDLAKRINAIAP